MTACRGWVYLALTMCLTAGASGAAGDGSAPAGSNTVIEAEELLLDYGRMIAVFEGNVDVKDPEVHITCDRLNVLFDDTNSVKSVTAFGSVKVYHQDKRAESDQAIYMAGKGEVELIGNARLFRGTDTIMGKKITFWLNDDKMKCVPGKLIIYAAGDGGTDLLPGVPAAPAAKPAADGDDDAFMQ